MVNTNIFDISRSGIKIDQFTLNECEVGGEGIEGVKLLSKNEVRMACPLFVPASKEGKLAKKIREEEDKMGEILRWKYKVVERGGRKLS